MPSSKPIIETSHYSKWESARDIQLEKKNQESVTVKQSTKDKMFSSNSSSQSSGVYAKEEVEKLLETDGGNWHRTV